MLWDRQGHSGCSANLSEASAGHDSRGGQESGFAFGAPAASHHSLASDGPAEMGQLQAMTLFDAPNRVPDVSAF